MEHHCCLGNKNYILVDRNNNLLHHFLTNKEDLSAHVDKYFGEGNKLIHYKSKYGHHILEKEYFTKLDVNNVCYGFFEEYQAEGNITAYKSPEFLEKYFFFSHKNDGLGIDVVSFLFVCFLLDSECKFSSHVTNGDDESEEEVFELKKKALVNVLFNKALINKMMKFTLSSTNPDVYYFDPHYRKGAYITQEPNDYGSKEVIECGENLKKMAMAVNICDSKNDVGNKVTNIHRYYIYGSDCDKKSRFLRIAITERFGHYLTYHLDNFKYLKSYCDLTEIGSKVGNIKNLIIDFLYNISD